MGSMWLHIRLNAATAQHVLIVSLFRLPGRWALTVMAVWQAVPSGHGEVQKNVDVDIYDEL